MSDTNPIEEELSQEIEPSLNNDPQLENSEAVAEVSYSTPVEEVEPVIEIEDMSDDEDLSDVELIEDDEDLSDAEDPLATPMRDNKYKRGTVKWVAEQHAIISERLDLVNNEFERLRKVLKFDIAILHSSRKLVGDKQQELDNYISAKESLDSWILERQGTFAWQLLASVNKEKEKIADFEAEIKAWTEETTEDLYQESHRIKKRFVHRFRWSILGIIFSLAIGWVVQQVFNYFGIGWITSLLSLLGLTNPFTLITRVIGYGSLAAWITNLFAYFRDYFTWKKRLAREIDEARFYLRASKDLDVAKGRVHFLSKELETYLHFLAELIHKPWKISDEWLNFEKSSVNPASLPSLLIVGKPSESGVYQKVTKRALESFASRNWHNLQFEKLMSAFGSANSMKEDSAIERVDSDAKMRTQLIQDITNTELLENVGSQLVIDLAKELQNEVLPSETGFYLNSIKPDALEGLDLTTSILGDREKRTDWHNFVNSILGPATDWSPIAFGIKGKLQGLQETKNLQSFALIPDRLQESVVSTVKPVIVNNGSESGVEVVVRIDASGWLDPDKVSILDGKKINPNVSTAETILPRISVDPEIVQG